MDREDRELLEKAVRLAEENNETVKKIYRHLRVSRWVKILYWLVILGAAVGIFYFLQPFIDQLVGVYSGFGERIENVNRFLDQFNGGS